MLINFFFLANFRRKESQTEENRYLFEQQTEVGSTIPPDTQNTLIIFLSAIAVKKVIFLIENNSALFLIAGIHSPANSKSL